MSDSKDTDINNLAAQYMDLWQKQMQSLSSERAVKEALEMAKPMQEGAAEMMKNLESPDKVQAWMTTWAETWKAQFSDGTAQPFDFASFAQQAQQTGTASAATSSGDTDNNVDELTRRIALLEERVAQLESELKDRS